MMDVNAITDKIEQSDMTACVLSWVLVCLYAQIGITYLAVVRTTVLYHSLFILSLTAFFLTLLCFIQNILSPRIIYIIGEKD